MVQKNIFLLVKRKFFQEKKGLYFALITSVISGISIFLNKFAVSEIKPPLYFTSFKNLIVSVLVLSMFLFMRKFKDLKKLNPKEIKYLFAIGIVGGSLPFYLYFEGLSRISSINGAIIHKTLVIWVALLAIPLLKEKISKLQILGVSMLFLSNLVVGGFSGFEYSYGEFLVLIATLLWGIENILAKKVLKSVDSDIVVLFRMGLGSLILTIFTLLTVPGVVAKTLSLNFQQIFWIVLTSLLLFLYVKNWYKALKYSSAIFVTSVLVSSTLITNILSAIFVTHSWNFSLSFQSIFILLGVLIFVLNEKNRSSKVILNTELVN